MSTRGSSLPFGRGVFRFRSRARVMYRASPLLVSVLYSRSGNPAECSKALACAHPLGYNGSESHRGKRDRA